MNLLITGAASGIGAAATRQALAQGHTVIAADLNEAALAQQHPDQDRLHRRGLDVSRQGSWDALLQWTDQQDWAIDALLNIAGVLRSGATGELSEADIALQLDVNVKGVMLGTNALAARMKARGTGHIINVGSVASLVAAPGITVYAASKFAVRGFSIAAAGDLREHGVAVSLVGPGPVKTAMLDQQRDDPNAALTFSGGGALTPEQVAEAILGPVMKKRPLEYYLPRGDAWQAKLANIWPAFLLSQARRARERGLKQFHDPNFE